MYMHYCRLCILNLCGCCMCCTHYYWHTQTHKWTNTSPLLYSPPCTNPDSDTAITVALFARSHKEYGTLTHPRNELGIRKSWGGIAAIQTMSYYCEDEDITDPGKIALKIPRGIGNEAWSASTRQGCQMQTRRDLTKYGSCLSPS